MRKAFVVLLLIASPAVAASIAGEWVGTGSSKDQKQNFYFVFLQDGTHLNGSGGSSLYDQNLIQNGKVDGDKISFDIAPGVSTTVLHFNLVASGAELKGTLVEKTGQKTVSETVELKKDKT